ncbi:hypothetical protein Bhyg_04365 [Pseudolycoriella hygida]|uniref:C2H2-type domain-containing protein n=1 Tax=Pseudolycoriella hygida TaxID=35572 RepID=A0A9Q0S8D4_9DIPT|nr:hypothetical protein Bhyg_04365 [Pseudolycoriella hygida]
MNLLSSSSDGAPKLSITKFWPAFMTQLTVKELQELCRKNNLPIKRTREKLLHELMKNNIYFEPAPNVAMEVESEAPATCSICKRIYKNRRSVSIHMIRIHPLRLPSSASSVRVEMNRCSAKPPSALAEETNTFSQPPSLVL